ncbi:MAG: hypothetical protein NZ898_02800 [Myxococcota bacterium]|nr:hypothetical protein [Myxococcota bacterium]MDW8361302.1 hypothetical protein [Myxococcales bacterium]
MRLPRPGPTGVALFAVAVAAAGAWGVWAWHERSTRDRAERRAAAEREAAERRNRERLDAVRRESATLVPEPLRGLALAQTEDEARSVLPALRPADVESEPDRRWLESSLPNGSRILLGFDRQSGRLAQIQVLSLLPAPEALAAHLAAMIERYGRPTGVWTCPDPNVPTRRFTWRRAHVAIMDAVLAYDDRISVTFYLADDETIGRSLRRSDCRPLRASEDPALLPVTTREALRRHREMRDAPRP